MELRLQELEISSPAFDSLGAIPARHTSDGENISPPLQWAKIPDEAKQLALICHDPDAPLPYGFTHWVLYNIPPTVTGLAEGDGANYTEGQNTVDGSSYAGPAPPPGHGVHHYYFWLYAIDDSTELPAGLDRLSLLNKISGHVVAMARVVGTYERPGQMSIE